RDHIPYVARVPIVPCVRLLVLAHSLYTRALPSFPTRRSSDLSHAGRCAPHEASSRGRPGGAERALRPERSRPGPTSSRRHVGRPDRKSTRLNSSHGSISYAVFCLKKKTKNTERHYNHAQNMRH